MKYTDSKESAYKSPSMLVGEAWQDFKIQKSFWVSLSVFAAVPSVIITIISDMFTANKTDEEILQKVNDFFNNLDANSFGYLVGGFILFMLISTILYSVQLSAFIAMAQKKTTTIGAAFKDGYKNLGKVFVVSLIVGLTILGGFLLLIVPGVLFSLWFSFAVIAAIDNKLGAGQAMKVSKALYKENARLVVLSLLVLIGLSLLAGYAIAIVSGAVGLLLAPLGIVLEGILSTFASLFTGFALVYIYFYLKAGRSVEKLLGKVSK